MAFVLALAWTATPATAAGEKPKIEAEKKPNTEAEKKPNILFIMGDDIGIMNVGAYHRGIMVGANVDPTELRHDSIGDGAKESRLKRDDAIKQLASAGYVRGNLRLLHGGGPSDAADTPPPAALGASMSGSGGASAAVLASESTEPVAHDGRLAQARLARLKGYEGDPCPNCANFTLVRSGTCLKCDTCGSTTGCS
jgi:hypothetical protein